MQFFILLFKSFLAIGLEFMPDFSTKMGETVIDVPLDKIDVQKEGRFIKKICFKIKNDKDEKSYKFGVLGTGGWLEDIQDAIEDFKNQ